ncbi:MAG: cupin domain-containing protein [Gemmatimonadales bacterium]|nr:cupin domain-containing protein [Gemmatimonadales bacterium]
MTLRQRRTGYAAAIVCAAAVGCSTAASREGGGGAQVRTAFSRALPHMDGQRLETTLLEVTYPPGGSSLPHRHPCPVIGYVVQGDLRTQVEGEPSAVYRAGETFYEAAGAVHLVSANASEENPVRFLAIFTCDRDTPLSVPVR